MTTTVPIPEMTQRFSDSQGAAIPRPDAEPIESPLTADAEEEEIEELWAADPGNQGA